MDAVTAVEPWPKKHRWLTCRYVATNSIATISANRAQNHSVHLFERLVRLCFVRAFNLQHITRFAEAEISIPSTVILRTALGGECRASETARIDLLSLGHTSACPGGFLLGRRHLGRLYRVSATSYSFPFSCTRQLTRAPGDNNARMTFCVAVVFVVKIELQKELTNY
jgi:hypothetical protein